MPSRRPRSLLLLVALLLVSGCGRERPWNLLLVTLDTTRADRIGCYGHAGAATPALDHLAADGVRFARAVSAAPITLPSHSTIMTGRYPMAHGVRDNGLFVLGDDQLTLAEILAARGYATAAAVGAYPVVARFGLNQGFALFDDHLTGLVEDHRGRRASPKDRLFFDERRAAQVNEAILPWLASHADGPFFLWVHYFDPHQPFEPPPPYDQVFANDPYDGEIAYADACLAFLLDRLRQLGALERTLVVAVADHGEGLGQHDELTHAMLAYESTLHVPLIIRPPAGAFPTAAVVEQRVATVDILPTVLELLGVERPDGLQGRSLVPLMEGRPAAEPAVAYAENLSPSLSHGWGELRALYDGPYKYLHGPRAELFDLAHDPDELDDLAARRPAEVARLRAELARFLDAHAVVGVSAVGEVDAELRRHLEALGYLHADGAHPSEIVETLRDGGVAPQDRVGDLNALSAAKHLLFKQRPAQAVAYTQKLVEASPDSAMYLELHAGALADLGRTDEAWRTVDHLRAVGTVPEQLLLQLVTQRYNAGAQEAALAALDAHLDTDPGARGFHLAATLRRQRGEREQARRALEQALSHDPHFAPARVALAVELAREGDAVAAEEHVLQALADDPFAAEAHLNYGVLLTESGRLEEAVACFRRAVDLDPGYRKAHLNLVAGLVASGDDAAARAAAERLRSLDPSCAETAAAASLVDGP